MFDESQILVAISAHFKIGNLCSILAKFTRTNKSAVFSAILLGSKVILWKA